MVSVPAPTWPGEDCALGIDEAGRGPVLGPMVYGCAYCPVKFLKDIASLGFDDSKKLTEAQRESFFRLICDDPRMGWAVDITSAEELSAQMLSRAQRSLNVIALESTARLIQSVLDSGARVVQAFVDTVGDPDKHRLALQRLFPSLAFTVTKKADSLFPIVSAASVVAKVTRDESLKSWVPNSRTTPWPLCLTPSAHEPRKAVGAVGEAGGDEVGGKAIPSSLAPALGSGYPGDPVTQAWLVQEIDPVFGFPSLVRFSWKTAHSLLEDKCVRVHWGAEEQGEEEQDTSAKKRRKKFVAFESCAPQRHSYFGSRQLQQISKGLL